jgi:hypothetical protein
MTVVMYSALFILVLAATYVALYKTNAKFVQVNGTFYKEKAVFFSIAAGVLAVLLVWIVVKVFGPKTSYQALNMRKYYMA